jgi:hypothetical protein
MDRMGVSKFNFRHITTRACNVISDHLVTAINSGMCFLKMFTTTDFYYSELFCEQSQIFEPLWWKSQEASANKLGPL